MTNSNNYSVGLSEREIKRGAVQRSHESKLKRGNNGQRFEKRRTEGADNVDAIRNVARKVRRRNLYPNKAPRDCHVQRDVRAQFAQLPFPFYYSVHCEMRRHGGSREVRDSSRTKGPVIALSVNNFGTGRTMKPRE